MTPKMSVRNSRDEAVLQMSSAIEHAAEALAPALSSPAAYKCETLPIAYRRIDQKAPVAYKSLNAT